MKRSTAKKVSGVPGRSSIPSPEHALGDDVDAAIAKVDSEE